jgi:hypothetical protein
MAMQKQLLGNAMPIAGKQVQRPTLLLAKATISHDRDASPGKRPRSRAGTATTL